jgi:hypothetical protein
MTALLSLAPVAAACYLLATLKGHLVLLFFLAASLAWCAWAVLRERRCAQLERLARMAEYESMIEEQAPANIAATPPVVPHPPAQIPDFIVNYNTASRSARQSMAHGRVAEVPSPAVHDNWRHSPGAERVRAFPMHKLTR